MVARVLFPSDNWIGAHPDVLAALAAAAEGYEPPYGQDGYTAQLNAAFSEVFECETFVTPVHTGTAANALALAAVTPGYGEIYCHEAAHIIHYEAGAIEFFTGGARLVPIGGDAARIPFEALEQLLARKLPRSVNAMLPATLSLTQATDLGTLYSVEHISALCDLAHGNGLRTHMDGARFANAVAALACSPADLTWRAGVDVLSFGAMKNGTLNAEAVICFDGETAACIAILQKRAGQLSSKQRFLAAELLAILRDGLWLRNAHAANNHAAQLVSLISGTAGDSLHTPPETNQAFCFLEDTVTKTLAQLGASVRSWPHDGPVPLYRLITSFVDDADARRIVGQALQVSRDM